MNDKIIIQANQYQVLPLNESNGDCNRDCNILQIFENQKYVSSIPLQNQGIFGITLSVDVNNIYDINVKHFITPTNDTNTIGNHILEFLKTPYNAYNDILKTSGLLNIQVDKTDSPTLTLLFDENEVYKNFTSPKGIALIINNKKFNSHSERHGTEIDEKNIKTLLSLLGYKIKYIYHDLSGKNILEVAHYFVSDVAHKVYDSCVVVVLTHGKYDVLLGSDGDHVNVHEFLGCFNSKNAPLLKGKPKLFFLQACRGAKFDCGVDAAGSLFSCLKQNPEKEARLLTTPPFIKNPRQPIESDILIAFATPANYVSWRNPSNGSWFIQSICEIFSKHSKNEDICSLLTKVNRRVAEVYKSSYKGHKQIPEYVSRLQKKFYFFPGIQM